MVVGTIPFPAFEYFSFSLTRSFLYRPAFRPPRGMLAAEKNPWNKVDLWQEWCVSERIRGMRYRETSRHWIEVKTSGSTRMKSERARDLAALSPVQTDTFRQCIRSCILPEHRLELAQWQRVAARRHLRNLRSEKTAMLAILKNSGELERKFEEFAKGHRSTLHPKDVAHRNLEIIVKQED
jgi:hypothetical protein